MPDFIVRLIGATEQFVIFETKGFDERLDEKASAAARWIQAVNRDGRFGKWSYGLLRDRARIAADIGSELTRIAMTAPD